MLSLSNVLFRLFWSGGNVINVQGNKMWIDVNDPSPAMRKTFQIYGMNLVHEEATTALFRSVAKPGNVVLDLGANIGYFALLAAKLVGPGGRVFAFEPEPRNFGYLTKNIELNGYRNIQAFQKAVSDKNGSTDLYVCSYDSGHHTIHQYEGIEAYRRGRASEKQAVRIETVALDDFLKDKTDCVDVIKMDVEGAEALALAGMRNTLNKNRHVRVLLEFFPLLMKKMGSDPRVYAESLLNDFGFSIYAIGHEYSLENTERGLIRVRTFDELMALLEREDDHVNLYLLREA